MIGVRTAADKGGRTFARALGQAAALAAALAGATPAPAQTVAVLRDVRLADGGAPVEVRVAYRTLGHLRRAPGGVARNAVLLLGADAGQRELTAGLFGPGDPLDTAVTYVIVAGGVDRAGLAAEDEVDLQYRLVSGVLGVDRLVVVAAAGTGCGPGRLWAARWPASVGAVVSVACTPASDRPGGSDAARWRAEIADLMLRARTERIE